MVGDWEDFTVELVFKLNLELRVCQSKRKKRYSGTTTGCAKE